MKQRVFDQLWKLRNEIAPGSKPADLDKIIKRLSDMGISVPAEDLQKFISLFFKGFGRESGQYYVPQLLLAVLEQLLEGRKSRIVCDPCAGIGTVLECVQNASKAEQAYALVMTETEFKFGRVLLPSADWRLGDPCKLLDELPPALDIVASVLPFGVRSYRPLDLKSPDGSMTRIEGDLGQQIMAVASMRLSETGAGFFVIPASFFSPQRSIFKQFSALGLGIPATFALPAGAFAPYTSISTYLVVVEKRVTNRTFVAQLSTDANTNAQVVANFKQGQEGAALELGRFVETSTFTGIGALRAAERINKAMQRFGCPPVRLGEIATEINLGRSDKNFDFPKLENAIFVPLIGNSDVVASLDETTLKLQNYAQLAIDPAKSDARFVARFLNSDLGKEIRETSKSGFIPKLNKQSLIELPIFIPDLATQRQMLATEARILDEQNILLGLQAELAECRRALWASPQEQSVVLQRINAISARFSGELRTEAAERLDQWFETLPFPLASILRAWQATLSEDFKTKYEHLLHFFEATTEFAGIIMLSAFRAREQLFVDLKRGLDAALHKQNLSLKRATFGTWKVVVEFLGKQVRKMLEGKEEERNMCRDIFADPSMQLPEMLSRKELAAIISATNKLRNDWVGHGAVVGQDEANRRNQQLLAEVQKLRDVAGSVWSEIQLVRALHCWPRRGRFENEVAVMMGSNSEFLKETRVTSVWLDVERLYLVPKEGISALELVPLIQVGPSPSSSRNACYFFNRVEPEGLRYVSYHFIDQPELKLPIKEVQEAISILQDL